MNDQIFEVAQGDAAMGMGVAILALAAVLIPLAVLAFIGGKIGGSKGAVIAGLLGGAGGVAYCAWIYFDLGNYYIRRDRPTIEIVIPDGYAGPLWVFYETWIPEPTTVAPLRYRVTADAQGRAVLGPLPNHDRLNAASFGPEHVLVTSNGAAVTAAYRFSAGGSFPIPGDNYVRYDGGYVGIEPDISKYVDAQEVYLAMKKETAP